MNGLYGTNGNSRPYGGMQPHSGNGMWGGGGGMPGMGMGAMSGMSANAGNSGQNGMLPQQMAQYQKQQQHAFMLMQQQQMYRFHMQQQQQQSPTVDFNKPTQPGWAESRPGRTPCKENWWSHVTKDMSWIDSPRGIDLDVESPSRVNGNNNNSPGAASPPFGTPGSPGGANFSPVGYAQAQTGPQARTQPTPMTLAHGPVSGGGGGGGGVGVGGVGVVDGAGNYARKVDRHTPGDATAYGALRASNDGRLDADVFKPSPPPTTAISRPMSPGSGDLVSGELNSTKPPAPLGHPVRASAAGAITSQKSRRKPSLFNVGQDVPDLERHSSDDEDDDAAFDSSSSDDDDEEDEDEEDSDYSSSDDGDASRRDIGISFGPGESVVGYSAVDSHSIPMPADVSASEVGMYMDALRRSSNPNGLGGHPLPAVARARQSNARGYSIPGLSGLLSASDVAGGGAEGPASVRHKSRGGTAGGKRGSAVAATAGIGAKKNKKDRSQVPPSSSAPSGAPYSACATPTTSQAGLSEPSVSTSKDTLRNSYALPQLLDNGAPHGEHPTAPTAAAATNAQPAGKGKAASATAPAPVPSKNTAATAAVPATATAAAANAKPAKALTAAQLPAVKAQEATRGVAVKTTSVAPPASAPVAKPATTTPAPPVAPVTRASPSTRATPGTAKQTAAPTATAVAQPATTTTATATTTTVATAAAVVAKSKRATPPPDSAPATATTPAPSVVPLASSELVAPKLKHANHAKHTTPASLAPATTKDSVATAAPNKAQTTAAKTAAPASAALKDAKTKPALLPNTTNATASKSAPVSSSVTPATVSKPAELPKADVKTGVAAKSTPGPLPSKAVMCPAPPTAESKSAHPAPRRSVGGGGGGSVDKSTNNKASPPRPAPVKPATSTITASRQAATDADINDSSRFSDGGYGEYGFDDAYNYYMDSTPKGRRTSNYPESGASYELFESMPTATGNTTNAGKAGGGGGDTRGGKSSEAMARTVMEDLMNGEMGGSSPGVVDNLDQSVGLNISGYMYF